jgi:2-polyprenyl-6-methoxyphenol hydroxylase-like FAD-dependent oxidoreductase
MTGDEILPVVVVGAGPTGLAMALGLARHGVASVLLERQPTTSRASKAPAIHVRTREILRLWGVEDRFLAAGTLRRVITLHSTRPGAQPLATLDFSDLDDEAAAPGLLVLEQNETERLLLDAVRETGLCDVRFDTQATALAQTPDVVRLQCSGPQGEYRLETRYVIGCDGASSFVRGALGLPFDGMTYALAPVLADIVIDDARDTLPDPRAWTGSGGFAFVVRFRPGVWRLVHLRQDEPEQEEVTAGEIADTVHRLMGPGPFRMLWGNRFRIHVRSSPSFRVGRVFLAGDAAHVHSPASGFGMNGGIHDAHNLGWKLARALDGHGDERLLDSYDVERRDVVVETTSRYADRLTRVFAQAPPTARRGAWLALRTMLRVPRLRRNALRRTAMLDLDYRNSPLLRSQDAAAGVRLPDPLLRAPDGRQVRLYDLLPADAVIIDVADGRKHAADLPTNQVIRVGTDGYADEAGVLRDLIGGSDGWILVRPDAHVAWARSGRDGMDAAVRWALGG